MEYITRKKIFKIIISAFSLAVICSLGIFIPQVRELIIAFGEKLVGRPLTHEVWHGRFIKWEIEFLCIILSCFPLIIASTSKMWNYISWGFIFIFAILLILIASQSRDIWLDETFSLGLARHNLNELIELTAKDVHPPLYYMILRIAMLFFPNSICAAKIVSAIPIIIILIIANVFFSKEFSSKFGLLFNSILLSTYSVFQYAVEIRMYSWCLLFCFLCCIVSYYIIEKSEWKYFFLYVIFAECGAYSQYWTAFGLAINFLLVSILSIIKEKSNFKKVLVSALLGILLYIPWAKVVLTQVNEVSSTYWIGPVTLSAFIDYISSVFPGQNKFKILLIFFILYYIFEVVKYIIKSKKKLFALYTIICFITPFALIICATIISILMRPVFQPKYAFPLIIFVIFFFILWNNEKKFKTEIILKIILIFAFLVSEKNAYNSFNSEKDLAKQNEFLEQTMKEKLTEKTVFLFSKNIDNHIPRCIAYRYPSNRIFNYEISELWTSAYFYDRNNLINHLQNEKELCLVLTKDEIPPEQFLEIEPISMKVDIHEPVQFYFLNLN